MIKKSTKNTNWNTKKIHKGTKVSKNTNHEENMFDNMWEKVTETIWTVEKEVEKQINKFAKTWIVEKIIKIKCIQNILDSKFVCDLNHKLQKDIKIIFKVLGRLAIIWGGLSLLMFFWLLFGRVWSGVVGWPLRAILYMVILFATSTISLIEWFGMLKHKKRLPFVALVNFGINIVAIIVSLIPITYVFGKAIRAGIWNSILSLIIVSIVLIIILKNKKIFTNK